MLITEPGQVMQELKSFLRDHVALDELWKVARGEVKYADFKRLHGQQQQAQAPAAPKKDVQVPEELVSSLPFNVERHIATRP